MCYLLQSMELVGFHLSFLLEKFKPLSPKPTQSRKKQETEVEQVHDPTNHINESSTVFTFPQDECVKVFQRSLEKHLSLEKCIKSLEKRSLLDLAKLSYKSRLEEGATSQVISFASVRDTREAESRISITRQREAESRISIMTARHGLLCSPLLIYFLISSST